MSTVLASHQADRRNPIIYKPLILARAEMTITIDAARKHIVFDRTASAFEPCQQTRSCVRKQFELNRATCFLLHYDCARPDLSAAHDVSNFHPYQVAAAKLAIDREVKQCTISQATVLIEVEPNLPYLLWL
ncbi:MAG: hypothetical protein A2792_05670 [Sphingomonadales bacterium RIFCSPHIGHO2_01_FULL_65_20]|nr:MAG: hypothetical protein A2792_05670 [Sphingomonadales bacterium RIFCSPHIGHO2_01_FULL_65_20]